MMPVLVVGLMNETTSIILPCYNGAKWLSDSIESILCQTEGNFELIIVNDGSTDNSEEIIANYFKDARIRYIYQKNAGFTKAVNRGINESTGSFIGFIGQDDLWMPDKLRKEASYLRKHEELGLVFSNYYYINNLGSITEKVSSRLPAFSSKQELIRYLFLTNFIGFETVLVRKECFKTVGLLDEQLFGFSDHDLWLRMADSYQFGYLPYFLLKKRRHDKQLGKIMPEKVLNDEFVLTNKAVLKYGFLKSDLPKKLSSLYFAWGLELIRMNDVEQARHKLLHTIRYDPLKFKALLAYMCPKLYIKISKSLRK